MVFLVCDYGLAFSVPEKHECHVKAWCSSVWCVLLKVMWKVHMEEIEVTWQLFLLKKQPWKKRTQVEGKRQSERNCLETHLLSQNSELHVRFFQFLYDDAKLQQNNVLSEGPYCAVRIHFDDDMTHQFFKALVPQLHLSKNKNVYCFPEGEGKKKKKKDKKYSRSLFSVCVQ